MGFYLGFVCFEKNLGINLGNYRNCSGKFLSMFLTSKPFMFLLVLLIRIFQINEPSNRCLTQEHRAVE